MTEGLAPNLLVRLALKLCQDDAYNTTPPSMCLFIERCFPNQSEFTAICNRIKTPPPLPAATDPFDAVILSNKLPFLGRPAVRVHLRSLIQTQPLRPVVVVNGPAGAGKTYTSELIKHASRTYTEILLCHVEISKEQISSTGPADLAREIVTQLGGDLDKMPQQQTNVDRWAHELALWVVNTAQKSNYKCWIVLDGFNTTELRRDTLSLVVKLSLQLTKGLASRLHRLILFDFDHTGLPIKPGEIALDTIPGLGMATVVGFLNEVLAAAGRPADAAATIQEMTADLPDPILDLQKLGGRLADLIELVG